MTFFKKLVLASISFSFVCTGIYVYGCADGWWGYSYISSFTPEAFADDSYKPLFYAPEEKFYDYAQLEYIEKYNEDIADDWKNYLGNRLTKDDIAFYLLNDSAQTRIDNNFLEQSRLQSKPTKKVTGSNKKLDNFFTFLHYAKRIEQSSTTTFSSWDYEDRIITQTEQSLVDEVESYYHSLKGEDDFFKNRMWFQVLKAKFYGENRADVIPFFEATRRNQPKNQLYSRALGYVAGAYYQQGQYDKSNRLFAILFNEDIKNRHQALYNFRPMAADSLEHLVKETPKKELKASLLAMNGYYMDAAAAMKQIYLVHPESPHIDFLLTRWVNAQEYIVNDYQSDSKAVTNWDGLAIDGETIDWLAKILEKPQKLHNPGLAFLAYGYSSMFLKKYYTTREAYVQARKWSGQKPLVQAQIRLLDLINEVGQLKQITATEETALLAELTWLYQEIPNDTLLHNNLRYQYASNWIKQSLSETYANQKDAIMAELLSSEQGFYDDKERGDAMEQFLRKPQKTSWETLFVALYPYNLSDIYESRAIYAYYQHRIDDAVELMQKAIPLKQQSSYTDEAIYYNQAVLRGNPFNGKIKDCNDCDHAAVQKISYTKLDFLKKVKELQSKMVQGTDVYANALLLGNAYYNTAFFGNARVFYYNMIIGEYGNHISKKNQPYLLGMENAENYYQIALQHATNAEQRAKISYLLAKVERNKYYRRHYLEREDYYWGSDDQTMFRPWEGFQALKDQYADTQYYQDVIRECGYFRTYIRQENSRGRY